MFAGWIAYRQWHTGHLKLKLDLFDRRLKVYFAALDSLKGIANIGRVSDESYFNLSRAIGESEFLFHPTVVTFLRRILDAARQHRVLGRQIDLATQQQDDDRVSKLDLTQNELEITIERELASAIDYFRPYLDFKAIR